MAQRTAKQKKQEKKIVLALASLLFVAILAAIMLAFPWFNLLVQQVLGIANTANVPNLPPNVPAAVHVINVGQGDATLIFCNNEWALIDAGTPESADSLTAYLRKAGVQNLRYVFITHPHADHIGGMEKVLEEFSVEQMVLPNFALAPYPTSSIFMQMLQLMLQKNITSKTAILGDVYPLGNGEISVIHAGLASDDNYNLLSLGLYFSANNFSFLNTGDAEKENEAAILESGLLRPATVFAAGHHGSYTSNTPAFVAAAAPKIVAISCAAGNSYGHPHSSPLAVFEEAGAAIVRTDKSGNIVLWGQEDGAALYSTSIATN